MSRKIIAISVLMLVLLSMNVIKTSRSEEIHEGNAYVGKMWLEILDTSNVNGSCYNSIVIGHVRAKNDWIVYSNESKVIANVSIPSLSFHDYNISTYPESNLTQANDSVTPFVAEFYLIVEKVINGTNTSIVGVDSFVLISRNCTNATIKNLTVPLDTLEVESNVTLLCTLEVVVRNCIEKKIINLNETRKHNLTFFSQDKSVVGVETQESGANFSYHLSKAEEALKTPWNYIPNASEDWNPNVLIIDNESYDTENESCSYESYSYGNAKGWYLGTLCLSDYHLTIEVVNFAAGNKEVTLYVGKEDFAVGADAYVHFRIYVDVYAMPTILWWKLGRPLKHAGGFGVEAFVPNYLAGNYTADVSVEGRLVFSLPPDENEKTITATLGVGACPGGSKSEDGYTIHLIRNNSTSPLPTLLWTWFPVGLAYKGSYEYVNEVNQTIEVNLYPMINNMQEDKVIFTFGVNTACSNINMTYEEVQEEKDNGEEQSTTNQNAEEVTVVYSCEAV